MSYKFPDDIDQWEENYFTIKFPDNESINAGFLNKRDEDFVFMVSDGGTLHGYSHIFHTKTNDFKESVAILNDKTEYLRKPHYEKKLRYSDIYNNMTDNEKKTFDDLSDSLAAIPELSTIIKNVKEKLDRSGCFIDTNDVGKRLHTMLLERSLSVVKNS